MTMSEASSPFDALDPGLEAALRKLSSVAPRDPRLAARGRAVFLAQAHAMRSARRSGDPLSRHRTLRGAFACLAALVLGSATAVYAAQASSPSNMLYPVKIWSEELRLVLARDDREQLNLLLEFSRRRLDELHTMSPREEASRDVYRHLERQMGRAAEIARQIGDLEEDVAASLAQLRDQTERLQPHLRSPDQQLPDPRPTVPVALPAPSDATPTPAPSPTSTPTPSATPAPTLLPDPGILPATPELSAETPVTAAPDAHVTVQPTRAIRPHPPRLQPSPGPLPELRETIQSVRATARAIRQTIEPSPPDRARDITPIPGGDNGHEPTRPIEAPGPGEPAPPVELPPQAPPLPPPPAPRPPGEHRPRPTTMP